MLRKITSIVLTISFIGVASSGILMMLNKGFLFQFKMHPVHNIFGPLMVIAALMHFILNFKAFRSYFHHIPLILLTLVLTVMMNFLYFAGFNRTFDQSFVNTITEFEKNLHKMRPSGK